MTTKEKVVTASTALGGFLAYIIVATTINQVIASVVNGAVQKYVFKTS
jgi:hypothetical protein